MERDSNIISEEISKRLADKLSSLQDGGKEKQQLLEPPVEEKENSMVNTPVTIASRPNSAKSSVRPTPVASRKTSIQSERDGLKNVSKKHIDLVKLGLATQALSKKKINEFVLKELDLLYEQLDINGNDYLQVKLFPLFCFLLFGG